MVENTSKSMGMMKSYFHFGFKDQFMFSAVIIDNAWLMILDCGIMFLLAILFEHIKYMRCVRCGCPSGRGSCPNGNSNHNTNGGDSGIQVSCYVGHLRTKQHRMIQTLLHTLQTTIGFLLMLAVMSFNLCIIFAVISGK